MPRPRHPLRAALSRSLPKRSSPTSPGRHRSPGRPRATTMTSRPASTPRPPARAGAGGTALASGLAVLLVVVVVGGGVALRPVTASPTAERALADPTYAVSAPVDVLDTELARSMARSRAARSDARTTPSDTPRVTASPTTRAAAAPTPTRTATASPTTPAAVPAAPVASAVQRPAAPAASAAVAQRAPNLLAAGPLYADPQSSAAVTRATTTGTTSSSAGILAGVPQARWIAPTDGMDWIRQYLSGAAAANRTPVLAIYGMPDRDCGGYSAGGSETPAEYLAWIGRVRTALAARDTIILLEPDALPAGGCDDGSAALDARLATMGSAVDILTRDATTAVYVDAGHEQWLTPTQAASRLTAAHVSRARGFSLNVSNMYSTDAEVAYGKQIARLLPGAHFVLDTSRNGAGPAPATDVPNWCNPHGRLAGRAPGVAAGGGTLDGYLWVKKPGESDGSCRTGEPSSGQWFAAWANDFVRRSVAAGALR